MKENAVTIIKEPINPSSSDIVAKIKSVWLSGKKLKPDWVPCPRPRPIIIPDPTAITAWIALYDVPSGSRVGLMKVKIRCFW